MTDKITMNTQLQDFITQNYNASAPQPKIIESAEGAYFTIDGKKMLNLCSSHYLGLAADDRIKKAVIAAVEMYGIGTGYRTLAGTHALHLELEDKLAKYKGTEAAIILTGGYMANCAAIQSIIGKEDIVISDELNHASIIDAVKISGVKNKYIYRHRDMEHLEEILSTLKSDFSVIASEAKQSQNGIATSPTAPRNDTEGQAYKPKILIVTDGVFSMDGDLAPLPEIVALAEKYGAITMVDDAHGEGVMGKGGRGTVDHFGLNGKVDIEVGTLSKAFSVMGGFITGKKALIDFYKQKARQFMFSNALTIADTAAVLEGVKILQESDKLVKKLWENTNLLKSELEKAGFDIGNSLSPITPVMLGDENKAIEFAAKLYEEGVFATSIRYPMVAKGKLEFASFPQLLTRQKIFNLQWKRLYKWENYLE